MKAPKYLLLPLLTTMIFCTTVAASASDHPKIEDIDWSFQNTVRYGESMAAFNYTNNSDYTIVQLDCYFKIKEGTTAEQLPITDYSGQQLSNEEIATLKPFVYDCIVCDPGETAEGFTCYITGNTSPTDTQQSDYFELASADISYIADDGMTYKVSYSAENEGYSDPNIIGDPFSWSDSDFAQMLPVPATQYITVAKDTEEVFYAKAYDISQDYFFSYIDECEETGFIDDYPDEESTYLFCGTTADGYQLNLRFIDYMKYLEITLEEAEE
ncbi:MAG: hypothetical protein Q4F83_05055 [Eubacteriales bacterium]|nr:hypothetical protein [Eubacteriales bacterium]